MSGGRVPASAREFDDWITSNGYGHFVGFTGTGHLRYRLTNGRHVIAAASPSDRRTLLNARATVRRMLGTSAPASDRRAGNYEFKPSDGYDGRRWNNSQPPQVEAAASAIAEIDRELTDLAATPTRDAARRARRLLERRADLTPALTQYGVPVPANPYLT